MSPAFRRHNKDRFDCYTSEVLPIDELQQMNIEDTEVFRGAAMEKVAVGSPMQLWESRHMRCEVSAVISLRPAK